MRVHHVFIEVPFFRVLEDDIIRPLSCEAPIVPDDVRMR